MQTQVELAISNYAAAYQKLFRRKPRNFQALDTCWAMINGVPVTLDDLQRRTARLECEYDELMAQKRVVVERLIEWCKQ